MAQAFLRSLSSDFQSHSRFRATYDFWHVALHSTHDYADSVHTAITVQISLEREESHLSNDDNYVTVTLAVDALDTI